MTPSANPRKILVCDDDEILVELLTTLLQAEGHKVVGADNGEHCLESCASEMPDLVILDLEMPHKNGFDVLEKLGKNRPNGTPYLMVLTADERQADGRRVRELGADALMIKPYEHEDLLREVNRLLASKHG